MSVSESSPASVRRTGEQAREWGITAGVQATRVVVLGGREQRETGADRAPPQQAGPWCFLPKVDGLCWPVVGHSPGAETLVPGARTPTPLCPWQPGQLTDTQSPGFSCCHMNSHSDSHAWTQAPCIPQATYHRAFAAWGCGLNPASLTCQLYDLGPVAAPGGSLSSPVR